MKDVDATVKKLADLWEVATKRSESTGESVWDVYNILLKEYYKKGIL